MMPTESVPAVLLVDADDGARASVADLLREAGLAVADARSGAEAIGRAWERVPALVILDPWPFVSAAAQLVARLRRMAGLGEVAVLVVTSATRSGLRPRARLVSVDGDLEKPCAADELLAVLDRPLSRPSPPGVGRTWPPGAGA